MSNPPDEIVMLELGAVEDLAQGRGTASKDGRVGRAEEVIAGLAPFAELPAIETTST